MDYQPSSSHSEGEEVGSRLEQNIGEEEEEDLVGGAAFEQARRLAYLLTGNSPMRIGRLILASGPGRSFPGCRQRRASLRSGEDVDPVPNLEGRKLMKSGEFGSDDFTKRPNWESKGDSAGVRNKSIPRTSLSKLLLQRELGHYTGGRERRLNQLVAQSMVPSTNADFIAHYNTRSYSGQFSEDGNFFYCCSQDFRVRMYDTSDPYQWKYYKTVDYIGGRWTITDATLSPDNRHLAYSSITTRVCLASTTPEDDEMHPLEFSNSRNHNRNAMDPRYGIWSIRFSGDGREIVAGANDGCLYVYDIETRTPVLRLGGHREDVNAVCYGDRASPHIIYSGSDDTTVKVWDRRSMADGREVGVFVGHTEGLTYVDSKGDGRYVLSNSKDQTMKLWDIRKMMAKEKFDSMAHKNYGTGFDYRSNPYTEPPTKHPDDCSLVTYRGHSVLKTLIRCHFSPPTSTGSRYVYTGSADGKVKIYNIDATEAATIDVYAATVGSRPMDPDLMHNTYHHWGDGTPAWQTCVRDVSWHPSAPALATISWNGFGLSTGTVTLHSWNSAGGKPKIYNAKLQADLLESEIGEYSEEDEEGEYAGTESGESEGY
ncbi:WD40-repeat-containing domain protein [Tuber borchii]|uniref:WD40-repeat-containing domain protein n=1 Tax=Tuber borchii TaxID=42251 RepID=A0A2T6ZPM6_TUBBO|nr:WD40-repeat-containing domain protein [Tuber borchii]